MVKKKNSSERKNAKITFFNLPKPVSSERKTAKITFGITFKDRYFKGAFDTFVLSSLLDAVFFCCFLLMLLNLYFVVMHALLWWRHWGGKKKLEPRWNARKKFPNFGALESILDANFSLSAWETK